MSEVNEASAGSRLPTHLIRQEWIDKAKDLTFFGTPFGELSRHELMAAIGCLANQFEEDRLRHRSTLKILKKRRKTSL